MNLGGCSARNGVAVVTTAIPQLAPEAWRLWIVTTCQTARARLLALPTAATAEGGRCVYAILGLDTRNELRIAATTFPAGHAAYPALTPDLPEAQLFERVVYEQHGIFPEGHPWLKPVRTQRDYPFFAVEGDAVHEVAVGPVHAGIIEPGHFRFQCHGEQVLHLEIALGYQHRGASALLRVATPARRAVVAESLAGDTVIGHSWAYAQAIEGLAGVAVAHHAQQLRALALELERLANHVGDLGALAADIGYLPAAAYFGRLRGEFLNLLMELTGNRYGRSLVYPGGVCHAFTAALRARCGTKLAEAERDLKAIADLFFAESTVVTRLEQTGVVAKKVARQLGLVGPAARASNLLRDVRTDYPSGAYRFHYIPPVRLASGDVYARALLRVLEAQQALTFAAEQCRIVHRVEPGAPCESLAADRLVVSLIEGWRGEIVHVVRTDAYGAIDAYDVVDPSFHNWMGLAWACRGGQISDFPLCNKSFNLSYAGHDL
ncbi:MAG: NADH-quinone oxidoreductase subunit C [Deltaproteobacteria bacterium]|nr:NADH-quinone oxidoreductase subunit C [Deltaproteobacteria bacterium]